MKKNFILFGVISLLWTHMAFAGQPVFSLTPLNPPNHTLYSADSVTVFYRVTNNSSITHTLAPSALPKGVIQTTREGTCIGNFTLKGGKSCVLGLLVEGNQLTGSFVYQPQVCQIAPNGAPSPYLCYQSSAANAMHITLVSGAVPAPLTASVPFLGLSVNNPSLNAALTGNTRQITITNTSGTNTASNLQFVVSPGLPAGTTLTNNCTSTLAPSASCTLEFTPGSTPTTPPGDISIPSFVYVIGDNTNVVVVPVSVFTYGSIYQQGYIFSIDDTTPATGSIGGATAALGDQSSSTVWGMINNDAAESNIPGIYETSVAPPCNGNTEGSCDTTQIVNFFNAHGVSSSSYAGGVCNILNVNGYTGWYLPSICEFGYLGPYSESGAQTGCGTESAPTLQNISSNLIASGIGGMADKFYWSSTESLATGVTVPNNCGTTQIGFCAWAEKYSTSLGSMQEGTFAKWGPLNIRCARALTQPSS